MWLISYADAVRAPQARFCGTLPGRSASFSNTLSDGATRKLIFVCLFVSGAFYGFVFDGGALSGHLDGQARHGRPSVHPSVCLAFGIRVLVSVWLAVHVSVEPPVRSGVRPPPLVCPPIQSPAVARTIRPSGCGFPSICLVVCLRIAHQLLSPAFDQLACPGTSARPPRLIPPPPPHPPSIVPLAWLFLHSSLHLCLPPLT